MAATERHTPTWRDEFPDYYAVPDVIATDPQLDDMSWHNDVCPSFTAKGYDSSNDRPDVRLWVAALKIEDREFPEQPRLMVSDGEIVIRTWDDDTDAGQAVELLRDVCRKATAGELTLAATLQYLTDEALLTFGRTTRRFNPDENEAAIYWAELQRRGLGQDWSTDAIVSRMKVQIAADIESGVLPATVASFQDLHDYVDANEYGDLCTPECPFDAGDDADAGKVNAAQDAIDQWLKGGRQ